MMGLFRSLAGMVAIKLTSADLPGLLAAVNRAEIPFFSVRQVDELTLTASVRRQDYMALHRLCTRRGAAIQLTGRRGLYWTGKSLLKRPVLLAGMLILLILLLYLPSRVFFVRVEGNEQIPANRILEAAEGSGIRFGASRREVRSERVKNSLLGAVPELQWAGVNTYGCVAVISVRERSITELAQEETAVTSIAAAVDGVVTSCTATSGNLLCRPGQAVKAGEILISGYTDCGLTIRATRAEGEVFAQTIRKITAATPAIYAQKGQMTGVKRSYSLIIGKKRINLWKDSGISGVTCGRMYLEYYVTLPGGFRLPIALAVEEYPVCQTEMAAMDENRASTLLSDFAAFQLQQQMVAGRILEESRQLFAEDGLYRLEGEYVCTEMIGRVQREQIGEYHGEDR